MGSSSPRSSTRTRATATDSLAQALEAERIRLLRSLEVPLDEIARILRAPALVLALVLHGERDLQPLAATRAFAAAFPNAEVQVVAGASHFPHAERPAAYAEAVGRFLLRGR